MELDCFMSCWLPLLSFVGIVAGLPGAGAAIIT